MPKFSLRDLFWLTLVFACLTTWWLERKRGEYERTAWADCGEAKAAQKDLELLTKILEKMGIKWGGHHNAGIYIESNGKMNFYFDGDSNSRDDADKLPGGPTIVPDMPRARERNAQN